MFDFSIQDIVARIPALLIGFAFHEFAHAYAAYRLGDHTAKNQDRLTLNPLVHLDPIGTLLILIAGFGWAKPVPVNPVNFTRKITMRKGMMLVSLAGPLINVVIALVAAIVLGVLVGTGFENEALFTIVQMILFLNIGLAVFNLLPIPPLDGSKILAGFLPRKFDYYLDKLERYGMFILLLLLVTDLIGKIIGPPMFGLYYVMQNVVAMVARLVS
ncbi:MAG: site-2 protease family protein [Clostridia bacterium]|nr:site-2 protease family protein [Clostridia bacterium]